jgi:hypothetical protein
MTATPQAARDAASTRAADLTASGDALDAALLGGYHLAFASRRAHGRGGRRRHRGGRARPAEGP